MTISVCRTTANKQLPNKQRHMAKNKQKTIDFNYHWSISLIDKQNWNKHLAQETYLSCNSGFRKRCRRRCHSKVGLSLFSLYVLHKLNKCFSVGKCPSAKLALTNKVYFHPDDFAAMDALRKKPPTEETKRYVKIGDFIFIYEWVLGLFGLLLRLFLLLVCIVCEKCIHMSF